MIQKERTRTSDKVRRNGMEQSRKGTEKDEEEGTFWKKGPTDYYKLSLYIPSRKESKSVPSISQQKVRT